MAGKSTPDPENFPARRDRKNLKGHDTESLGPSDSSDSGSDMKGPATSLHDLNLDDNSDSGGTGERLTAGKDPDVRLNQDREADRVIKKPRRPK